MTDRFVVREKRARYARLPAKLYVDPRIKAHHMMTYAALASFADFEDGKCFPSVLTIAKRARLGERRVRIALEDFEKWGDYVIVERSNGGRIGKKGRGICHTFTLIDVPAMNEKSTLSDRPDLKGLPCPDEHSSNGQTNETQTTTKTEEKTKTSSLPSPALGPRPSNGSEQGADRPVAPAPAAPKPEAHGLRLVKAWAESFKAHFGKDCVILWGRDVKLMNRVVESYGAADTEKMLHAFWRFRVKTGKPVTIPTFYGVADRVYFDIKDGGRGGRS